MLVGVPKGDQGQRISRNGLNVHGGKVTYRAVADALKLPYTAAEEALRG